MLGLLVQLFNLQILLINKQRLVVSNKYLH